MNKEESDLAFENPRDKRLELSLWYHTHGSCFMPYMDFLSRHTKLDECKMT